jgi:crotonobetainyl-CoA:carnitine CoA-transferase CaiB-like acyl-CoA transferase
MLGQHTDDILRELGHDDTAIARLRTEGTVA